MDPEKIAHALGRIEAKLDNLVDDQASRDEDHFRLELRIRKLEQFKAWLIGIGAASGAATSTLLNKLGLS